MAVLVIAEHDNAALRPGTLNTLAAAQVLGGPIDVLVAGSGCQAAASAAAAIPGVDRVRLADDAAYEHQVAEDLAPLVADLAKDYGHVLAPASTFGKNLLPRVSALMDLQMISEISGIEAPDTFTRPIYAGNAIATVQSSEPIKLLTIRSTAFDAVATEGGSAAVEPVPAAAPAGLSRFAGQDLTKSDRPELTTADVVVSGGRGLASQENFAMIERLAEKLGAAVGASRAAVDAGYAPNDYQVGQTGKVVAPNLYVAIGISGAIQHLAGMKDSKVIVAINKDEEAPIFQVADYGLVADLF
ncbi:MAG: FAD-binding protein, partial [Rhodospirillaceae bacterium]|nr:FAD-binding protein [Rhodospirillaceae bacterium]